MIRKISTIALSLALAACTASVSNFNEPTYDFAHSGSLLRNAPGLTPGAWYLLYDDGENVDLTIRLGFDYESLCIEGETREPCGRDVFEQGLNVTIRGMNEGAGILVSEMDIAGN